MKTVVLFIIEVIHPDERRTFRSFESTIEGVCRLMTGIVQGIIVGNEDEAFAIIAQTHEYGLHNEDLYSAAVMAFMAHQQRVRKELEGRVGSPTGVIMTIDATMEDLQPMIMIVDYEVCFALSNNLRSMSHNN